MKKICILVCTICVFSNSAISITPNSAKLSNIEKQLFGYEFQNNSEGSRIDRIENYLYGRTSSNTLLNRINKVSSDVGIIPEKTSIEKNTSKNNKVANNTTTKPMTYEKEDSSVQYPIVDKIENRLFNRSYNGENIYARLDRLEKKVFSVTSSDNLSNRVNKLRLAVLDTSQNSDILADSADTTDSQPYSTYSDSDSFESLSKSESSARNKISHDDSDFMYKSPSKSKNDYLKMELSAAEENLFKQSFQYDSTGNRLDRLETQIFKRNFEKDADSVRMQRISAATTAHKTSKAYDNNHLMRNINTGVQIGSFLFMILAMIL